MASAVSGDKAIDEFHEKKQLGFLALPLETQKDIFGHCSQTDLICLSLVSRHFRELSAAQLYRNFHIVFPDEDDPAFDSPIDSLAGGLETFVSSDYDYSKHLKDISLDTLSAGDKAETAYKPYLYNASCGKFMNTLLLLTLRKAKSLETFRWNIRVELSRPVYRALHQIDSLSNLHIRMQAGPSLFEIPPPLPYTASAASLSSSTHWDILQPIPPGPPPPMPFVGLPPLPGTFAYPSYPPGPPPPLPPLPKLLPKNKRRVSPANDPPTLSGFKKLKTLAVLDIDNLDIITEIKSSVRNSSSTLTKLKLSFSQTLASQSRKPPPDADPDDSDVDDEFQVVAMPPTGSGWDDSSSGPAKAFRAQEERKSQESVLGRIFDVEPYLVKQPQHRRNLKGKEKDTTKDAATPAQVFMNRLKEVSAKLVAGPSGAEDGTGSKQAILDMIEKAAKKYLESEDAKDLANTAPEPSQASVSTAVAGPSSTIMKSIESPTLPPTTQITLSGFSDTKPKSQAGKEVNPEDINVEEPVTIEEADETLELAKEVLGENSPFAVGFSKASSSKVSSSTASSSTAKLTPSSSIRSSSPDTDKALATLGVQKTNFENLAVRLKDFEGQADHLQKKLLQMRNDTGILDERDVKEAETQLHLFNRDIESVRSELHAVEAEIHDAEKQVRGKTAVGGDEAKSSNMSEYIRSTRGLALQSLSIHLIPVKASVLSRAVDLRTLKKITLLNVGNQAPIWTLLAKENKVQPLALRKIFTDNVSGAFLTCVGQLEEVHELFMLERSTKYKPESFAPKTTITTEQIRRKILRKHMNTLVKLMIKNDIGSAWDIDEKTILLICNRGTKLEELAMAMGIRAVHIFLQHLSGLAELRALNITHFRNDDTCVWVMRETRRFLVDNLSHYPNLKLEWISIDDDRVERILRAPYLTTGLAREKKKDKGKAKAANTTPGVGASNTGNFPPLPLSLDSWDSGSDSDDEDTDLSAHLKLETIEGVHFYDVWGVRIFKKEIMAGRL